MDTFDYNWDLVANKLMEMGASKQQTEAKIAKMVFQLCANDEEVLKLFKEKEMLEEIKEEEDFLKHEVNRLESYRLDTKKAWYEMENKLKEVKEKLKELPSLDDIDNFLRTQKYIDDFNEELKNQETKEARDKLRTAQLFMNTVEVKTPQNNTYFIGGLASILSGVEFTKIPKLEKVKKIDEWAEENLR